MTPDFVLKQDCSGHYSHDRGLLSSARIGQVLAYWIAWLQTHWGVVTALLNPIGVTRLMQVVS
jgi:hypothetical protein